ncbi:regulator of chromosome condensation [Anaeramoeba flamelloides]|uniref:Regulator of chromosome condensation n=1 Tax=Anaeramoeba flamelloides TaxID=1746091 RepID=A0AAV7ZIG1_9EUKA|nr:regulator of chromosome condensation [Anaeramoeba flamelloides]
MVNYHFFGENSNFFLGNTEQKLLLKPKFFPHLESLGVITKVVSKKYETFLLNNRGEVYQLESGKPNLLNLTDIVSISAGKNHNLALSHSGKVYSWGSNPKCLGFGSVKEIIDKPQQITTLSGHFIKKIKCGKSYSFLLDYTGNLFAFGQNSDGQYGNGTWWGHDEPQIIQAKVKKIFLGYCSSSFMIKENGKLYASGNNVNGCLGSNKGNLVLITRRKITLPFDTSKLKTIKTSFLHSLALTTDGDLYSTGGCLFNGQETTLHSFKKIKPLKNVIKIGCGHLYSLVVTKSGEFYCFGSRVHTKFKKLGQTIFKLDFNMGNFPFSKICVGHNFNCSILQSFSLIEEDFLNFFKSQELADYKIQDIPVHSFILKLRTGNQDLKQITDILKQYPKNQVYDYLQWIYSGQIIDNELINTICADFGINSPSERTLLKSISSLYSQEDQKDFAICVIKNKKKISHIKVHKILLQARCGMFLEMFKTISQNMECVSDYSNKSVLSMQKFMKYLYTDVFEINENDDIDFLKSQFEDVRDYYQLNKATSIYQTILDFENKYLNK